MPGPPVTAIQLNGVPVAGFSPPVLSYAINCGISMAAVTVAVDAPGAVTLTVNGQPAVSGVATAPIPVGISKTVISVTASGPAGQVMYALIVTRGVSAQEACLKSTNPGMAAYFGDAVAVSGNTVVVGSWQASPGNLAPRTSPCGWARRGLCRQP